jgi:hypothetical protein
MTSALFQPVFYKRIEVVQIDLAVACEVGTVAVIRTRAIFGSPPVGKKAIIRKADAIGKIEIVDAKNA